ncbi:SDR family oxidoreductase [Halobacterium litoreum]|uniref:SDR family oxidoreductase n=1 Tax=Halobacterium litoreum TaxID=2039234 RepID=A0ABD5NDH6_9EURY|nr:SDR family oxidoreductase [Halobacterium litoreum]UHH13854.1 SDR family oxidoreductase [Halobacterium litoreum]
MATVLVAGASGGTGLRLLDALAATDYEVRATTRSASKRERLLDAGADDVAVGDLTNRDAAARAVRGVDRVLCAVGSKPDPRLLVASGIVDDRGVRNLVHASVAADVDRFVLESAIGVGDSKAKMARWMRVLLWPVLDAKNRAEAELRTSGLEHVIVRPGGLTDAPATRDVLVAEGGATVSGTVPRADVARLMVAALDTPAAANRTFEVVSRDGLRGRARGLVDIDWAWPDD